MHNTKLRPPNQYSVSVGSTSKYRKIVSLQLPVHAGFSIYIYIYIYCTSFIILHKNICICTICPKKVTVVDIKSLHIYLATKSLFVRQFLCETSQKICIGLGCVTIKSYIAKQIFFLVRHKALYRTNRRGDLWSFIDAHRNTPDIRSKSEVQKI